ncbi:MAG: hypothetical protein KJ888_21070, partial [Gammaproteobacteria bacterium]|nr:hypothetical protein [Gammaproteobacteria bacterium]
EGGKPWDPVKMERSGRAWAPNHNFRGAASDLQRAEIPYFRLVNDAPKVASCYVVSDDANAAIWQQIFEEEFDRIVRAWSGYFSEALALNHEYVLFGLGSAVWLDEWDWRWKALSRGDLLVEKDAPTDIEEIEIVCLRRKLAPTRLWRLVKDDESAARAEDGGWNADEVRLVLINLDSNSGHTKGTLSDWERRQNEIRNNDLGLSTSGYVNVVELYAKEFDGSISKYVIPESCTRSKNDLQGIKEAAFMYAKRDFSSDMRHVFAPVFFEIGTGDWHSSKGFGQRNHASAQIKNRTRNILLEAMWISSKIGLINKRQGSLTESPVKVTGSAYIIPDGLTEYKFSVSLRELVAGMNVFDNDQRESNAIYESTSKRVAEAETATQGELIASLDRTATDAQSSLYLAQLGRVYEEMVRRMRLRTLHGDNRGIEAAREFKKRCVRRGIPEKEFHEVPMIVKAGGDSSMANPIMRQRSLMQLLGVASNPTIDERAAYEDWVAGMFGLAGAKRYIAPDVDFTHTDGASYAIVENGMAMLGRQMPVLQNQMDEEHLPIHIFEAQRVFEAYQTQGQLTREGLAFLTNIVPHMQAHIEKLRRQEAKKEMAQMFADPVQQFAGQLQGIQTNLARQQARQAEETNDGNGGQNRTFAPA